MTPSARRILPSVVLATLALAIPATAATAADAPSQSAAGSGQAPASQSAAAKRAPAGKVNRRRAKESSAAWMMG